MSKRGLVKVRWNLICLPHNEGGLALRNFKEWNKVIKLRLIWLLFTNAGSLWVAWNKEHRLKKVNFWSQDSTTTASWIWKSLLSIRPLANKFLKCKIGNRCSASFWFDNWCYLGPLINYLGTDGPRRMGIPIQSSVLMGISTINQRFSSIRSRSIQIQEVKNMISTRHINIHDQSSPDVYFWSLDLNVYSNFSNKQTWDYFRNKSTKKDWTSSTWFKGATPNHAFTFWIANLDRLPLNSRLANWGLNIVDSCSFCSQVSETRDHIFLSCEVAAEIWKKIHLKLGNSPYLFSSWNDLIRWISRGVNTKTLTIRRITTQALIYILWNERNARKHNTTSRTTDTLYSLLDRKVRDTILAHRFERNYHRLLSLWFTHF